MVGEGSRVGVLRNPMHLCPFYGRMVTRTFLLIDKEGSN
jgi:hypothetical protein